MPTLATTSPHEIIIAGILAGVAVEGFACATGAKRSFFESVFPGFTIITAATIVAFAAAVKSNFMN